MKGVSKMAKYVDGFVFVVPKNKLSAYKEMAEEGAEAWMRHGALSYYECVGEDLVSRDMGGGKPLEFTKLTKAKPNEIVCFSFIVYKSKKQRDEVNKKVISEMNKKYAGKQDFAMPFDMKPFAHGGFEVMVEG